MLPLYIPFAALVVLGSGLAGLTIWSHRLIAAKVAAIALTGGLFAVGYGTMVELLGRPKPMGVDWFGPDLADAQVLAAEMHEDEAIYLWLAVEGEQTPVSYVMPWSQEAAEQLHGAMEQAEEEGGEVQMRDRYDATLDDQEPMFYAAPETALPPKE
jgi:hypothetical protein